MTNLHEKLCPECGSKMTASGRVSSFCARGHKYPTSEFTDPIEFQYFVIFKDGNLGKLNERDVEMAKERIKISGCSGMEFEDSLLSAYIMGIHDASNYNEENIMIGMHKAQKE